MKDEQTARTARQARTGGALRRLALASVLALAVLAFAAAGAQAVIVTLSGQRIGLGLLPNAASRPGASPALRAAAKPSKKSSLLVNHGGAVMASNTNYAIFWDPSGGAAFPAGYQAGIEKWFVDLAHDSGGLMNTDAVLAQYGASYNSHFGGAYIDTDPYPANGCAAAPVCLSDAQIRAELASFVQAHSLPADLEHAYFLLTPSGVESCTDGAEEKVCSAGTGPLHRAYCSYHQFIELPKGLLVYAYTPYMAGLKCGDEKNTPNGNPSDEELSGGLVHEHSEAVTDPELNAWYDEQRNEVGDKCRSPIAKSPEEEFGPEVGKANGSKYNQVINGDVYWYQQEWSNEAGGCAQRKATVPTIKKMAPKSGPETGNTSVTITGTGFVGAVTVDFGTTPAAKVTVESATTIVAVSPKHEAGKVYVTVTTAGGTSQAESSKAKFKYKKVKPPKAH